MPQKIYLKQDKALKKEFGECWLSFLKAYKFLDLMPSREKLILLKVFETERDRLSDSDSCSPTKHYNPLQAILYLQSKTHELYKDYVPVTFYCLSAFVSFAHSTSI